MDGLRQVVAFAREWHAGVWTLDRLPELLGVEVREQDGDPHVLGLSLHYGERRLIVINSLLRGSSLRPFVVAHEGCHHLLGHKVAFCNPGVPRPTGESAAWYSLALLAIPEAQVAEALEGRVTVEELAQTAAVPVELAALSCAIRRYLTLDRLPGKGELGDALLGFVGLIHRKAWHLAGRCA